MHSHILPYLIPVKKFINEKRVPLKMVVLFFMTNEKTAPLLPQKLTTVLFKGSIQNWSLKCWETHNRNSATPNSSQITFYKKKIFLALTKCLVLNLKYVGSKRNIRCLYFYELKVRIQANWYGIEDRPHRLDFLGGPGGWGRT